MRCRRALVMAVVTALVWLGSGPAAAQDGKDLAKDPTMEVLREKVRADKKLVVAVALDLSEGEAKEFWPVYAAYQSDMVTHYDRVARLIGDYAAAYSTMTDAGATELLGEFLALRTEQAALLQRYLPRFQRALPPKKLARFYQIENKIRAIVDYQLAADIPLVK